MHNNTIELLAFLDEVRSRAKDPAVLNMIIAACTDGVRIELDTERRRAADMETVATMAIHTRLYKTNETYIAKLLEKWQHRASIRWDDVITKLKAKGETK